MLKPALDLKLAAVLQSHAERAAIDGVRTTRQDALRFADDVADTRVIQVARGDLALARARE